MRKIKKKHQIENNTMYMLLTETVEKWHPTAKVSEETNRNMPAKNTLV